MKRTQILKRLGQLHMPVETLTYISATEGFIHTVKACPLYRPERTNMAAYCRSTDLLPPPRAAHHWTSNLGFVSVYLAPITRSGQIQH
jgi:hypothetical protein